jgi:hypothetical protein
MEDGQDKERKERGREIESERRQTDKGRRKEEGEDGKKREVEKVKVDGIVREGGKTRQVGNLEKVRSRKCSSKTTLRMKLFIQRKKVGLKKIPKVGGWSRTRNNFNKNIK